MSFLNMLKDIVLGREYIPLKDDFKIKERPIKDGISLEEIFDEDGKKKFIVTKYKDGKVIETNTYTEEEFNILMEKEYNDLTKKETDESV